MHEMAIMTSIVDVVVRYANDNGAKQVRSITLVVGELHDVVDSLMERCFQFLARGTVAQDASLELKKVPPARAVHGLPACLPGRPEAEEHARLPGMPQHELPHP